MLPYVLINLLIVSINQTGTINEKARIMRAFLYQYVMSSLPAVLKHPTVPEEFIGAIDAFTLPVDTSDHPDETVAPHPDGFC